mgnify:CR=1 FL=1|tara:strand:- start:5515 stop:6693 length:1179 start_codon:yes stop_codon:yes gene_type:complete
MGDHQDGIESKVDLSNWRFPPYNRWAFQHVSELVESVDIKNDSSNNWELTCNYQSIDDVSVKSKDGSDITFDEFLEQSFTDGFMVIKDQEIIYEKYLNGMDEKSKHILMSVSKSVLGVVSGILIDQKQMSADTLISDCIPELKNSGYADCTIQNLLDMTASVNFEEDYYAISGPMIEYRRSTNWDPPEDKMSGKDLKSFLIGMEGKPAPHGETFKYTSPNSDLLGWVIERSTGSKFQEVMSEVLWKPLGAADTAYVTVDESGSPRTAGGMNMTLRDLALIGNLVANGGYRGKKQIISNKWLGQLFDGDRKAWESGNFAEYFGGMPITYRNQWYTLNQTNPILFCVGIYGQYMFVDLNNKIVIAKFSSQEYPLDADQKKVMTNACLSIINHII